MAQQCMSQRQSEFSVASAVRSLSPIVGQRAAETLLDKYGSLKRIAAIPTQELRQVKGLGPNTVERLKAAFELSMMVHAEERIEPVIINCSHDVADIVAPRLRDLEVEQMRVVLANGSKRYLGDFEVATGSANLVHIEPCNIFKYAIEFKAASIYLAHNHPSGDPTPSSTDITLSKQIAHLGRTMRIPLLEHVVIGKPSRSNTDGWVSLWDEGHLNID